MAILQNNMDDMEYVRMIEEDFGFDNELDDDEEYIEVKEQYENNEIKEENSNDTQDIANIKDNKSETKKEQNDNILSEHEKNNNFIHEKIEQTNDLQEQDEISKEALQSFESEFVDINNVIKEKQKLEEQEQEITTQAKINNDVSHIYQKLKQTDDIFMQEQIGHTTQKTFQTIYKDFDSLIDNINKNDEKEEKEKSQEQTKRDTKDLEDEPNIDKELDDLDKAMDNILKSRSLADFIRALYILDKALYEIKLKKEKPKDNKMIKELKDMLDKGKPLTKEIAIKAINCMAESKNTLDNFVKTRRQEREVQQNINKNIKQYHETFSNKKKDECIHAINENMAHAKQELPNFQNRYAETMKKATNLLKEHEKKAQIKTQDKGRTL